MVGNRDGGGKLPGKTKFAGRRREMTRSSGFSVHAETSGGEFRRRSAKSYKLTKGQRVDVTFRISGHRRGALLGYGAWFWYGGNVTCSVVGGPEERTLTSYDGDSWNKVGSMWAAGSEAPVEVVFTMKASSASEVAIDGPVCGRVTHRHLEGARHELLRNMYQFAPEAVFVEVSASGVAKVGAPANAPVGSHEIFVKSCNRCGRYLPINVHAERDQLSFSNHCVADHRRPCKHATFGNCGTLSMQGRSSCLTTGSSLNVGSVRNSK